MNDKNFDEMLKKYYSQKAPSVFKINQSEKPKKIHKTKVIFKYISASACAIFILAITLIIAQITSSTTNKNSITNNNVPDTTKTNSFVITAYAAEIGNNTASEVTVSSIDTVVRGGVYFTDEVFYFYKSNDFLAGSHLSVYDINLGNEEDYYYEHNPKIIDYHIALNINGDNIKSFDLKSNRGNFNYSEFNRQFEEKCKFEITPEIVAKIKDNNHIDTYDYDANAENIEYNNNCTLFWFPDTVSLQNSISKYAKNTVGVSYEEIYQTCTRDAFLKYFKAQENFFKERTLNEYIQDTIEITVHFTNKPDETALVDISLDKDGNFILKQKQTEVVN